MVVAVIMVIMVVAGITVAVVCSDGYRVVVVMVVAMVNDGHSNSDIGGDG
jgi:hypothetical protein